MWWLITFYTVRLLSSTSMWMVYYTASGTYHMVKFIYLLKDKERSNDCEIIFSNGEELCQIQNENNYDLIITKESLMFDLMHLHDQVELIEKREIEHDVFEKNDIEK